MAGNTADPRRFLTHALTIAPGDRPMRERLARLPYRERHLADALAEFDRLLIVDPAYPDYRNMRAAIAAYRAQLADALHNPDIVFLLQLVMSFSSCLI